MIDFSIIIPAKNEEDRISACLSSIISNNYSKNQYEVIVVDNGSSDKTVALAESLGARVERLPEVNISALRNYGAQIAKGRMLAFLDADCTVSENWMDQASRYLVKQNVSLFGSPPVIPEDSTWVQRTWLLVRGKRDKEINEVPWLESMNMFIPRKQFIEIGGFNERLVTCEDVDISYRLANYGKVISDLRIKVTHHGEARTLLDFFRKENWRGKSNYVGLKAHGLKFNEVPSLMLPIYFLIMPVFAGAISFFSGSWFLFLAGCTLWQLPICLIVMLKLRRSFSLTNFGRLWLLYNVYYSARSIAII